MSYNSNSCSLGFLGFSMDWVWGFDWILWQKPLMTSFLVLINTYNKWYITMNWFIFQKVIPYIAITIVITFSSWCCHISTIQFIMTIVVMRINVIFHNIISVHMFHKFYQIVVVHICWIKIAYQFKIHCRIGKHDGLLMMRSVGPNKKNFSEKIKQCKNSYLVQIRYIVLCCRMTTMSFIHFY